MADPALLAIAHGSRDRRFAANAYRLMARVRQLRPDLDVRLAFLELSEPNIVDVLGDLDTQGCREAVVVPLLLSDAYHARIDLPTVLSARCPGYLRVWQAPVLGADPALLQLARRRVSETGVDPRTAGVILTAVGSSDVVANARTRALAAQLATGTPWVAATTTFATGTEGPTLAQTANWLRRRGADEVVVMPWFMSPGLLLDRVRAQAAPFGIPVAEPLGADPVVAEVVLARYTSAIHADVYRASTGQLAMSSSAPRSGTLVTLTKT